MDGLAHLLARAAHPSPLDHLLSEGAMFNYHACSTPLRTLAFHPQSLGLETQQNVLGHRREKGGPKKKNLLQRGRYSTGLIGGFNGLGLACTVVVSPRGHQLIHR